MKDYLTEPEHWCQGTLARDAQGVTVPGDASRATAYCLMGAMNRFASYEENDQGRLSYTESFKRIQSALPGRHKNIAEFNDTHTHAEVLALLEKVLSTPK